VWFCTDGLLECLLKSIEKVFETAPIKDTVNFSVASNTNIVLPLHPTWYVNLYRIMVTHFQYDEKEIEHLKRKNHEQQYGEGDIL